MTVIHFVAKILGVYRPAIPCSVDVARILDFADKLAADKTSVPIQHA